jgi:hypothetical protein
VVAVDLPATVLGIAGIHTPPPGGRRLPFGFVNLLSFA